MSYIATVYKVMIASPGDVQAERGIIREVIEEWNIVNSEKQKIIISPIGWETHSHPEMGDRPQEVINRQILTGCDLLIAVFWTRLGSPTGKAKSGTVEEIEEHCALGKPAMLYFSSAPVRLDTVDKKQSDQLNKFKAECYAKGLVENYGSIDDFRDKLRLQLAQCINRAGWGESPRVSKIEPKSTDPITVLTEKAQELLLAAAAENGDGQIMTNLTSSGFSVETNGQTLYEGYECRQMAYWKGAIDQLKNLGYIDGQGEMFNLTARGWQMADELRGTVRSART